MVFENGFQKKDVEDPATEAVPSAGIIALIGSMPKNSTISEPIKSACADRTISFSP